MLDLVSDYFWNVDETANAKIAKNKELTDLLKFRNDLKGYYSSQKYYLFLLGVSYPNQKPYFSTFESDLEKKIKSDGFSFCALKSLFDDLSNYYSYVYIPVESAIKDVLHLEAYELQELMSRDLIDEIDNILNEKFEIDREQLNRKSGHRKLKVSVLKVVNEKLDNFINEINQSIKSIDNSYLFSYEQNTKKRLTASDTDEYYV